MNNIETENTEGQGYIVTAVNIKYGKILNDKIQNRPDTVFIEIPDYKLKCKDKNKLMDIIETYVYDYLTKRYGAECYHCQIYPPLD